MSTKRFVKAADTGTPVGRSRDQLEAILRRYGCVGFGVHTDYEKQRLHVVFKVAESPGSDQFLPVRLEVDVLSIASALYGPLKGNQTWKETALQQAERVAWRHLVLWVDAACSASSAGMQTMAEAFFAHTLIKNEAGQSVRIIEQFTESGGLKRLTAGTHD